MSDSPNTRRFHNPPDIVLYHAECSDGFGAAWAIWKQYPNAIFMPVKHGIPPPPDLKDHRVVIVDFSYTRPILETMASETKELLILDHHGEGALIRQHDVGHADVIPVGELVA